MEALEEESFRKKMYNGSRMKIDSDWLYQLGGEGSNPKYRPEQLNHRICEKSIQNADLNCIVIILPGILIFIP